MNEPMATYSLYGVGAAPGGRASAAALALGGPRRKRAPAATDCEPARGAVAIPAARRCFHTEVRVKVDPGYVNHPKFLRLKKAVGELAMEFVIRIWGHCQQGQKGEYWRGADAGYVEAVAMWTGTEGKLFEAMAACRIILIEANGIRVNDWNRENWRTVSNWQLGGRPKRNKGSTKAEPTPSQGLPKAEPTPSRMNDLNDLNDLNESGSQDNNNGASAEELKTQYAALTSLIEKMEPRRKEFTEAERGEFSELKKKRAEVQRKQALRC